MYQILMDYTVTDEQNAYTVLNLEGHNVEIEIKKSVVSDYCFIDIKIDGDYYAQGKLCLTYEGIIDHSKTYEDNPLLGDFFFGHTTERLLGLDFDLKYLGTKLYLFYDEEYYERDES